MSNSDRTLLVFLLDRSGSMQSIKSDVEGGFAAFIDEQRQAPGECAATLAQFDTQYEVVYHQIPVGEVPALNLQPRGGTALLDAMGKLITDTAAQLDAAPEAERPGTVIVAIMTDGYENSSQEWTHPAVKSLVQQQTKNGWEFLYMGADQDAVEVGVRLGVQHDKSVTFGRGKARDVMAMTSANISRHRAARIENPDAVMDGYSGEQRADVADG
ncbi:vWA domain-containing protein [Mycobacterium sp. 3519A]|uniref:vWA domain-containing protein n=1 Tax=Mycobacterium sp. 3519A TaxID=2057184 RepID=UPI000C7B1028|nr:vWA domain-containing protein [Mycobacterium sp. 3519A]